MRGDVPYLVSEKGALSRCPIPYNELEHAQQFWLVTVCTVSIRMFAYLM